MTGEQSPSLKRLRALIRTLYTLAQGKIKSLEKEAARRARTDQLHTHTSLWGSGTMGAREEDSRTPLLSLHAAHGIHCPSLCAKKSPLLSASKPLYLPSALKTLSQSPTRPSRPPTRYHIISLHFLCKAGAPRSHLLWLTCLLPVPHRRT